jgi:hypothetical protein
MPRVTAIMAISGTVILLRREKLTLILLSHSRARFICQLRALIEHSNPAGSYLFLDDPFLEDFFFEDFFLGTLPPALRASDNPIAIACFLLVTFFPDLPLFRVPSLRSCIAFLTLSCDFLPYLAIVGHLS